MPGAEIRCFSYCVASRIVFSMHELQHVRQRTAAVVGSHVTTAAAANKTNILSSLTSSTYALGGLAQTVCLAGREH
jgi:hypothetical protein